MRYVIIGNGVAGVTAAGTIAADAKNPSIQVIAAEPHPYYRRPWLPDLISGAYQVADLYHYPSEWYQKHGVEVWLGKRVVDIDPALKIVTCQSGEKVAYDRLLIAAGGNASVPPIQGARRPEVFTLRTIGDALAIKEFAGKVRRAAVIGGGLLGLEAARALRANNLDVTVVEIAPRLMPRQLDAEGAGVLERLIELQGIRVVTGIEVKALEGEGRLEAVRLGQEQRILCEMALISAGIQSEVELPRKIGLAMNRGAVADEYMESSLPNIYLAGDVAEAGGRVYGSIQPAIEQARVAAANMVGGRVVRYAGTIPSHTLKVMGIDLTSIGVTIPTEAGYTEVRHSDAVAGVYRKLVLRDGKLVGAILLGDRKAVLPVSRLIQRGTSVGELAGKMVEDGLDWATVA